MGEYPNGKAGPAVLAGGSLPADRYRWVALSNTTLGMLMATVNASIVIISLPADLPRGSILDPLHPATSATCCGR